MKKAGVIIGLILAAVLVVLLLIPAGPIRFEGHEYYSESELREMIFGDNKPRYLVVRLSEWLGGHKDIPLIDHYELAFGSGRSITVRLYERSLAGALKFQDYYMYFDWSGTLVESSQTRIRGVFEVQGLTPSRAVIGEKLPLEDQNMIDSILTISQFLRAESIEWKEGKRNLVDLTQAIRFSSEGVGVVLEDIEVVLGGDEEMDAKLYVMADILPQLAGRQGILYLNNYQPGAVRPHYVFKEASRGD